MKMLMAAILVITVAAPAVAQTGGPSPGYPADHPIDLKFQDVKWQKIMPDLGDRSPEISILHVDQKTQATKLMIRVPKDFYVPQHWHTANETHTVINGTFIIEHGNGRREELGPGSFNYIPAKMVHQAWTKPEEGALLFITVDAAWDINWVEGPPTAK